MRRLEFPSIIKEDNYICVALAQIALIRLRYLDERAFDPVEGPFLGLLNDETKRAISNFKGDQGIRPVNFIMNEEFTGPLNQMLFKSGSPDSPEASISERDLELVVRALENARANLAALNSTSYLDELSESAIDCTKGAFTDIRAIVGASLERDCN